MTFKQINIHNWRQYRDVDIQFHDRLTVITGANGVGKTTILNLLNRHFGWHNTFVSTPKKVKGFQSLTKYLPDYWTQKKFEQIARDNLPEDFENDDFEVDQVTLPPVPEISVGKVVYSNGSVADIRVPTNVSNTYSINFFGQALVKGLYIPSHRPLYNYQPIVNIPAAVKRREELYSGYQSLAMQRFFGQYAQFSPNYYIKEALISLALFGYGNQAVEPDSASIELFESFQEVLSLVLPPKLKFKRLSNRSPEVVLVTGSGEFSLDAASGGVAAIIDVAWQIFMFASRDEEFVATFDEPENHLHPELQRSFLPNLMKAFPRVQFVVASHNPFIIGSVPESNVYVLDYDKANTVQSLLLDTVNRAGSSNEILREVLGLEFTIPLWVENRLESFIEEFEHAEFTNESVGKLRTQMQQLGLENYVPNTIAEIVKRYHSHGN